MNLAFPTFTAGLVLCFSLCMALGPQTAHVLRMGLQRRHLWLTVAVCAVADIGMIAVGVLGLARLGGLPDKMLGALIGAGVLFLGFYGWQALRRCLQPVADAPTEAPATGPAATALPGGRRQAVASALAFSWLNPHAWIDTAVLIGTASLAYGQGSTVFGMGAAAGSLLWFLVLGTAAFWLGRRLQSLRLWRVLDGAVAVMMWGTAGWLLTSLA